MRILLASSSSGSRGGGEIFLLYLGEALRMRGHVVGLWASTHPKMDELAARFRDIGDVVRTGYTNTYDRWDRGAFQVPGRHAARALAEAWMSWRPDLVHLNKQNLEDAPDFLAAAPLLPVPHVCTIHITQTAAFLRARFAWWRDLAARRALRHYRGPLIAVADTRGRELRAFVGNSKDVRVVLNGIHPMNPTGVSRAQLRAGQGIAEDDFAVAALGRLESQKQPLRFLAHAAEIRRLEPHAIFHWLGAGRMDADWDREVQRLGLGVAAKRCGWSPDAQGKLPAYDLFLHTAGYEGLPLALLEAMDAGLACAVESGVYGQLPVALQHCAICIDNSTDWRRLLSDRVSLSRLGAKAQTLVRNEFSTATMARAYEEIYSSLRPVP
ncbi:glycosyltransferase family 4 protein [Opitutus sp. ER46]|uniref:glycosyltransferase family 4 protein n=1 Tax=Opitutus sp. ER46 TaxID=2161864 RepID=UPI001304C300|nr:glycosyltransferase family 4 protein [Opitutus sp. ER46]